MHVYKNNNVIFLQTEEADMIRMIVLDKKVFMFMYLKNTYNKHVKCPQVIRTDTLYCSSFEINPEFEILMLRSFQFLHSHFVFSSFVTLNDR